MQLTPLPARRRFSTRVGLASSLWKALPGGMKSRNAFRNRYCRIGNFGGGNRPEIACSSASTANVKLYVPR
jgi:hypothetical protein